MYLALVDLIAGVAVGGVHDIVEHESSVGTVDLSGVSSRSGLKVVSAEIDNEWLASAWEKISVLD